MNIKFNITDSKKDLVKAGNTTTMFKDVIGDPLKMTGLIIYDKEEVDPKTGEIETKTVSAIKLENGEFISSISPTVENSLTLIANSFDEAEKELVKKYGVDKVIVDCVEEKKVTYGMAVSEFMKYAVVVED